MFRASSFEVNRKPPRVLGSPIEGHNLAGNIYWCRYQPKMSRLFVLWGGSDHITFYFCGWGDIVNTVWEWTDGHFVS